MQKSIIIAIIAVIVLLGVGGLYFYLSQPAVAPSQTAQESVQPLTDTTPDQKVLHAVSGESKATYELNEVLNGKPNHVVGVTTDVAGDIAIDVKGTEKIKIGEIKVNARTFKTDVDMRDQNVRKLVLKSDVAANEFIVFKTTGISQVPATIERGKEFPIVISGDITIAGVTKPATFNGTANLSADNTLTINANTTLTYGDFGVSVPNFSFLANVDKTVKLSIVLIAR